MMRHAARLVGPLLAVSAIATSTDAHGEDEIGLALVYDPRVPVGGLGDLVPSAPVGLQGKWEYYAIADRLAVGFQFQYHYFQSNAEVTTVPLGNGAATAPFTRYAYFIGVIPTVRYFPLGPAGSTVRPFAELGAGATSATSALLVTDLSRREKGGGFIFQPCVGVLWALASRQTGSFADLEGLPGAGSTTRESMFALSTSLGWAFTTADVVMARNVSYVGVQVGVYSKL